MTAVQEKLRALGDREFAAFTARSIPHLPPETILGVRTPALRKLAKELAKSGEGEAFLAELPHAWFEENQLHAFLVGEEKDFSACRARLEAFLPYMDNWATCDQCAPKAFKKNREALPPMIREWLGSERPYTVRFGIKTLMDHFLEEDFSPEYLAWVAEVRREHYYVQMMQAWYFATALAKQWDAALPFVEGRRLDPWVHNKTIQKAAESYRIPPERKEALKALRLK